MIEFPGNPFLPQGATYKNFTAPLFGDIHAMPDVKTMLQHGLVMAARLLIPSGQFYFITDGVGDIVHANGIYHCLGHPDKTFTIKKLIKLLHPAHAAILPFYVATLYARTPDHTPNTGEEYPLLHCCCSIRSIKGLYWYCRRSVFPIRRPGEKSAQALLHTFVIVKEYDNELFELRIPDHSAYAGNNIVSHLGLLFKSHAGFSSREHEVLQLYALGVASDNASVAKKLSLKKSTVETFNQRIIRKTEDRFHYTPPSARDAAVYFKKLHLIQPV